MVPAGNTGLPVGSLERLMLRPRGDGAVADGFRGIKLHGAASVPGGA